MIQKERERERERERKKGKMIYREKTRDECDR
jgi:hypothetical protein